MLNSKVKDEIIKNLESAIKEHESIREDVELVTLKLFEQRQRATTEILEIIDTFHLNLVNSPLAFDKAVNEYYVEVKRFQTTVHNLEMKAAQSINIDSTNGDDKLAAGVALTGVATGGAVAAFGPTAAIAIATTFGTASTGTAISALSGAAATNAALAWLGGGALAAGGAGMAAGNALLSMAGPIGWTIAGLTIAGGGLYLHSKNAQFTEEATQKLVEVKDEICSLNTAECKIRGLSELTRGYSDGCLNDISYLQANAPSDYMKFNPKQKERLGKLISQIRSLSKLLNSKTNF